MCNDKIYINIFNEKEAKVLQLPIEYIVEMMLAVQAPIDFDIEFLKVQAIVARTILTKKMTLFGGEGCSDHNGCDICDTGHCVDMTTEDNLKTLWQENYEKNKAKLHEAVKATEGLVVMYNNRLITARYHHTCGGSTENSEDILGNRVVYLRKVLCDYCKDSPCYEGEQDLTLDQIKDLLNIRFPRHHVLPDQNIPGFIESIKRDQQQRVKSIKIGGENFKGKEVMDLLNLNSTRFKLAPVAIRFMTKGKGDGLGLCQYGGHQMTKEGYSYEDVIRYYYTGVEVKKIERPCIESPLKGKIIVIDPGHGGDGSMDVVGPTGLREQDLVLDISKRLKRMLEGRGAEIHLTREEDSYVSLNKRIQLSDDLRPDFFLSLHFNHFPNPAIQGCEAYYYRSDQESQALGEAIINSLNDNLSIVKKGIKTAEFFILKKVGVSCLHLEIDFLSNPEVEKRFRDTNYIDQVVDAITKGILNFYHF